MTNDYTEFIIYPVIDYKIKNFEEFIQNRYVEKENVIDLCSELENNKSYHFRIHNKTNYIFFGDLDGYQKGINVFMKHLQEFLKKYYNLSFTEKEFKYTENNIKPYSYHYSIPKWYTTTEKLKEMHSNFLNKYSNEFIKEIDTTIYSEHWFRCPNQSKGHIGDKSQHIIKKGKMKDFVVNYIPTKSVNIDNCMFIDGEQKIDMVQEIDKEDETINFTHNDIEYLTNMLLLKRCDKYDDWLNVGMCLHNINKDYLYIWRLWSQKSAKYEIDVCEQKWKTFKKVPEGLKIGSLLLWCKTDNKDMYEEFIQKRKRNSFIVSKFPKEKLILGETIKVSEICNYINLKNHNCLLNGKCHDDLPNSMYIEVLKNCMTIKCKHPECFGKIYPCDHLQLTKQEMNIAFYGNVTININNKEDDELVEFQQINIYEDDELNRVVYNSLNGEPCSLAKIVFYKYKDIYNYSEYDDWYVFENKWKNIGKKNVNLRYSTETILRELYTKLITYYKQNDNDKKRIDALKRIIKSFDNTVLKNNIMTELGDLYLINNNKQRDFTKKLDNNKYLIGFNNGVYDLKIFQFRNGTQEDYITMSVNYDYIDKHTDKYENLLQFLDDIQPNKDELDYMLTYISIGLVGNLLELFTILTGTGRNGKSKLIELLKETFGDYFGSVSSQLFTRPRPSADSPDPGLLNLLRKKIVISSEPEKDCKLNTGFVKFITGRDSTSLRHCHQNEMIDFKANFLTLFTCNDIPECDNIDSAFAKRLRCINFPMEFVNNPKEENQKLIDININENFSIWKQDFMLLLIEYYKKYTRTNELKVTKNILKWTDKYKEDTDIYLSFLNENTEENLEGHIHCVELYGFFKLLFKRDNPNSKIPNNKDFVNGIKKYKKIENIRIDTKIQLGIKNLKLIE